MNRTVPALAALALAAAPAALAATGPPPAVQQQNAAAANALCQAEQADASFASTHGGKTFDQLYGSGKQGKNAFGNCVSSKTQSSTAAERQATPNPSQTCTALQKSMTAPTFTATYKTFGTCVSQQAKAQSSAQVSAASACRTEAADAAGFAAKYGTADNAFGKCVATRSRSTVAAQNQTTVKAAKACAAERKADATAFRTKYATFRACVLAKAKA
ncbi:MAG TPA: hypothetical protein VLN26_18565 [Gaiellaceae bacterium]|nr:hypothetical protein [Gaiellaceae bacterium]